MGGRRVERVGHFWKRMEEIVLSAHDLLCGPERLLVLSEPVSSSVQWRRG